MKGKRVLLADDHVIFRECLSVVVQAKHPEWHVQEAGSWMQIHDIRADSNTFHLALLDLHMPCRNSWEYELRLFMESRPQTQVCIITGISDESNMRKAFQLGVKGYLYKTSGVDEVERALEIIDRGGTYLPPSHLPSANSHPLSKRQQQILLLLTQGLSNKKIGLTLGITESTVKRHMSNIFEVLNVKSRLDAVRSARERAIID